MRTRGILVVLALSFSAAASVPAAEEAVPFGPVPSKTVEKAHTTRARQDLVALLTAVQTYKIMTGKFPNEKQGLACLVEQPTAPPLPERWVALLKALPKDPWGRDYRYARRAKDGKDGYVLFSDGEDKADRADDVELAVTELKK